LRPTTLVACLLAALPGLAAAQSLSELYRAAVSFDATYLAAKANAQSADYRAAQVEALARPSVVAAAGVNTTQNQLPALGSQNGNNVNGAINGRLALFNRANGSSIEQARRSLLGAQADLEAAEQDLIVRVAQAYFDLLGAQDTLATTRASKAAITEQLASAKRNFEVGTATITDAREAQARYDLAIAQEIAADNDLHTRRIALDTLVGRSNVEPRPLALPPLLPEVVPANAEEWVTQADQLHPTVRQARVALEVATLETEKARAGLLPTLDAVATLSSSRSRGGAVTFPGTTTSATVGVEVNWSVYAGGATQNRIRETLALEEKARDDLDAARRAVAQGARVAYFGVQSGRAQVRALEAAEASSKLALEATQLGYKVGVRVNLDVLNAQTQLYTTQRDLARARYDVLMGTLRLHQAAGQLAASNVDVLNRLLVP
jgi:outer membrane protein